MSNKKFFFTFAKSNHVNMDQYIKSFEIISLWDRMDVRWNDVHQDVNVLVGINGAGKTTLLNTMYNYYHSSLPKELRNCS